MEQLITQSIDRAIAYYMVDNGLSQKEMASLLGMTANTLRQKRSGKSDWYWSEVLNLSRIVGKSLDELAGIACA